MWQTGWTNWRYNTLCYSIHTFFVFVSRTFSYNYFLFFWILAFTLSIRFSLTLLFIVKLVSLATLLNTLLEQSAIVSPVFKLGLLREQITNHKMQNNSLVPTYGNGAIMNINFYRAKAQQDGVKRLKCYVNIGEEKINCE